MPMTTVRDYLYDVGSNAGANFASAFSAAQNNRTRRDEMAAQQQAQAQQAAALEEWRRQQLELQRQQQALDQAKAERAAAMDRLKMQEMIQQQSVQQQFQQGFTGNLEQMTRPQVPLARKDATPEQAAQAAMQAALATGSPDLIFNTLKQVEAVGSPKARPIFDEISGEQIGNVFKNTVIPIKPEAGGFAPVIPEGATDIIGWQQQGTGRFVPRPAERPPTQAEVIQSLMDGQKAKPAAKTDVSTETVVVVAPDGSVGTIPKANLDKALKNGYKLR